MSDSKETFETLEEENLTPKEKKTFERLDKAISELTRRSNARAADELAERCRKLANMLAGAAAHIVVDIRRRQQGNQGVDPRELSSPSLALEKVTKAVEAYAKFQQARVDMQSRVVAGEVEAVRAKMKSGDDGKDLKNKIYRHNIGKASKTPVLTLLKTNKRKPAAEMTEEEKKLQYADEDTEFDGLPREMAEYSEVQTHLRPEFEEEDEGRS